MKPSKIEDAGEKLGGARKDAATGTAIDKTVREEAWLEVLWPKPAQWSDLIPEVGAHRAALVMVAYENLAKRPHRDGWLGISGQDWERAYRFALPVLKEVLQQPGKTDLDVLRQEFNRRMREFGEQLGSKTRFTNQWSYAIGSAGSRTNKHPLQFTPIDDLRAKYLGEWGWGEDHRVSHKLSMGALKLRNRNSGHEHWRAVKGVAGHWAFLEDRRFETEQAALDCTRVYVMALLGDPAPRGGTSRKADPNWIRPRVEGKSFRDGFPTPNSQGKTHLDLLETFGFRGVEFGNWVSQSERQRFVDAAYDAFGDLTTLLGMPSRFASLNGKLGLAFGSRGKGLSKAAAHFEPGKWVLHFTKESGPGSVSHEFAHALDAWIADFLWGQASWGPRYASEEMFWEGHPKEIFQSQTAQALQKWATLTGRDPIHLDWVNRSIRMDCKRKNPYWSDPCEIFARAFEVLVADSLRTKTRHNDMLVHGVSDEDGQKLQDGGVTFPYPTGSERQKTCEAVAAVVRAYRNEFLLAISATTNTPC